MCGQTDNSAVQQKIIAHAQEAIRTRGGDVGSAKDPRDKPPVMVEMDALANAFSRLENTSEALNEQLGMVKNHNRGAHLANGNGAPSPSVSSSPLVEYLREMTARADALQTRLATLRDIVEV